MTTASPDRTIGDHRADQVLGEARPEVLRRHLAALPLQLVQFEQPPQRRVDLVRRDDTPLDPERRQLAQLGAGALGLAGRRNRAHSSSMGTAGSSRHSESSHPAPRPRHRRRGARPRCPAAPRGSRSARCGRRPTAPRRARGRPALSPPRRRRRRTSQKSEMLPPSGTRTGSGPPPRISGAAATSSPPSRTSTSAQPAGPPYDSHQECSQAWLWNGVAARAPRYSASQSGPSSANRAVGARPPTVQVTVPGSASDAPLQRPRPRAGPGTVAFAPSAVRRGRTSSTSPPSRPPALAPTSRSPGGRGGRRRSAAPRGRTARASTWVLALVAFACRVSARPPRWPCQRRGSRGARRWPTPRPSARPARSPSARSARSFCTGTPAHACASPSTASWVATRP